jgi:hypothetical protein
VDASARGSRADRLREVRRSAVRFCRGWPVTWTKHCEPIGWPSSPRPPRTRTDNLRARVSHMPTVSVGIPIRPSDHRDGAFRSRYVIGPGLARRAYSRLTCIGRRCKWFSGELYGASCPSLGCLNLNLHPAAPPHPPWIKSHMVITESATEPLRLRSFTVSV